MNLFYPFIHHQIMISLHMKLMGIIIIFNLYQNEYYELVNIYLKIKKSKIDKYINRNNEPDISKIENSLRRESIRCCLLFIADINFMFL